MVPLQHLEDKVSYLAFSSIMSILRFEFSLILSDPTVQMECVSRIMKSDSRWQPEIRTFWKILRELFNVQKTASCGTHVHVAPWQRRYSLAEVRTIAFACCYYERYIVSCMPTERRDYDYCRRNSKVVQRMGQLYRKKTRGGLAQIATDILATTNFNEIIIYMQGSAEGNRRVLWNFRNLTSSGTIEFRGGRHMRGSERTVRWISFVVVFILMALDEVSSRQPYNSRIQ